MCASVRKLCWLLPAAQLWRPEAKVQAGSIVIGDFGDQGRWQYLAGFGFGLGQGEFEVRVRRQQPSEASAEEPTADLDLYLDEDWDRVLGLDPCERVTGGLSRKTWQMELQSSGDWSEWANAVLEHRVRRHIWYFALSTCRRSLPQNGTVALDFEFHARQEDGAELSVEMIHMPKVHVLCLLVFSGLLVAYAARCRSFCRSYGSLHPVIWILTVAMALQYAAQVFQMIHLWRYKQDGAGSLACDILSWNAFMASQIVHTALLVAIARGYTLLRLKVNDAELIKPIIAVIVASHAAIVGFRHMYDDEAIYRHHEHQGVVGWAILVVRFILFLWFLRAVRATQLEGGVRLEAFLHQFSLAGSTYLLAYPAIFLIVQLFAPYLRHPIMHVGLLMMQLASNTWLASLFLSRGVYFKVSTLSASMLPGSFVCGSPSHSGGQFSGGLRSRFSSAR